MRPWKSTPPVSCRVFEPMLTAPLSEPSRLVRVWSPPILRVPSLVRVAASLRRSAAVVLRVAPLATLMVLVASKPDTVRVPALMLASPVKSLPLVRVSPASPCLVRPPAPVMLPVKAVSLVWLTVRPLPLLVMMPLPLRSPMVSSPPSETVPSTLREEELLMRSGFKVVRVAPAKMDVVPLHVGAPSPKRVKVPEFADRDPAPDRGPPNPKLSCVLRVEPALMFI